MKTLFVAYRVTDLGYVEVGSGAIGDGWGFFAIVARSAWSPKRSSLRGRQLLDRGPGRYVHRGRRVACQAVRASPTAQGEGSAPRLAVREQGLLEGCRWILGRDRSEVE